jgi:Fe-Mn family superoxide dismutase
VDDLRQIIDLIEAKSSRQLELKKLPYAKSSLSPVLSAKNIENHYDKLARGYVDRYNAKEGDPVFNEAGAFLHNLFFEQFQAPKSSNRPSGPVAALIDKKYGSFVAFKSKVLETAMGIQGSGWVYLSKSGELKTIKNHAKRNDIKLLIDWWEHAWYMDYGTDKKKYLENIWRIINWTVINSR